MTKRTTQTSTVVVPAVVHTAEGAAPATAKAATAATEVEAGRKSAVVEKVASNDAAPAAEELVLAAAAPAPLAMVQATTDPAAATTAQDTGTTADDGGEDATPYIVGGVLLAGGILAVALSGGDDDAAPAPPPPPPPPVNTAPTITSAATANVAENVAAGAAGAVVLDVNATDAQNNTITYSITGGDAALFTISATTGEVRFVNSPNFEAVPTKTSYTFTVTATDNGTPAASTTQNVTLTLTNVNEAPTFATGTTRTVSFAENSTAAVVIDGATDPDANTTLTYTLTGADAALFAVNAATGVVTFRNPPDFEATPTKTTFNFNLVATDNATPALSATQAITVNLTDVANEGVVLVGTQNLSAAGADIQYIESAGTANTTTITGFGVGDTIVVDAATSNYSFTNNGADLIISYANNGIVNQITLVGAVNANAVVTTEATAEQAVGSNFFLAGSNVPAPPAPPASAVTIDGAGAQATYSAANAGVTYTENAGVANTTTISNFGSDDRIVVQGATAGSYSFTNTSTDLIISFANNGVVNSITLAGVVGNPNAVVTTEASAEQLLGFDFFRYA
jgi:hypothetical protein